MNTQSNRNSRAWMRLFGSAVLFLLLIFSTIGNPVPVHADAGGWPTATPTITNTPTLIPPTPVLLPTPIPTSPDLIFPPTPTFTPVVPAFGAEFAAPELQAQVITPQTANSVGFTWLTCIPFGIVILAIALGGFFWLRSRGQLPIP